MKQSEKGDRSGMICGCGVWGVVFVMNGLGVGEEGCGRIVCLIEGQRDPSLFFRKEWVRTAGCQRQ